MPLSLQHKKWFTVLAVSFLLMLMLSLFFGNRMIAVVPFFLLFFPSIIQQPIWLLYLLLATLPLSTEYHFTDTLGTDFPDELLMIALTGMFILQMAANPALLNKKQVNQSLFVLLLIHFLWMIVCTVYSENILLSFKYLLAKTWYIVSFVLVPLLYFKSKRRLIIAGFCLLLPMLLTALISIYRHAGFGFSFEKINTTLVPFFRNHVNYGAMLVCLLPVNLAWIYLSSKKIKQLAIVVLLVLLAALFLSYSRGAWLAVPVALVLVWAVKNKIVQWVFVTGVVLITIVFTWLAQDNKYLDYRPDYAKTIFHTDFRQHLAATYRGKDLSTAERFYRWTAVKNMVAANPITGVGPNNFYDTYKPFTTSAFKTYVSDNKEHSTVHNYFFLLLTEQGIFGLLFFLALLLGMFWYAQKIYHKTKDRFYRTIALTLTAMLAAITTVNFLSDLIETDKIGSLFFLCLGILLVMDTNQDPDEIQSV